MEVMFKELDELYYSFESDDNKIDTILTVLDRTLEIGVSQTEMVAMEEYGLVLPDTHPINCFTEEPSNIGLDIAVENIFKTVGEAILNGFKAVGEFIGKIFKWVIDKIKGLFGGSSGEDIDKVVKEVEESGDNLDKLNEAAKSYSSDGKELLRTGLTDDSKFEGLAEACNALFYKLEITAKDNQSIWEEAYDIFRLVDLQMDKDHGLMRSLNGRPTSDDIKKNMESRNKAKEKGWIELYGGKFKDEAFAKRAGVDISDFKNWEKSNTGETLGGENLQKLSLAMREGLKKLTKETRTVEEWFKVDKDWYSNRLRYETDRDISDIKKKAVVELERKRDKITDTLDKFDKVTKDIGKGDDDTKKLIKEALATVKGNMNAHRTGIQNGIFQVAFTVVVDKAALKYYRELLRVDDYIESLHRKASSDDQ
jgi:transcriptional regulator with XRE-family HTH domain